MTLTIGAWILPMAFTAAFLLMMFRPYRRSGDYDFGEIFRLFWLIPIGWVWAVYFAAVWWVEK